MSTELVKVEFHGDTLEAVKQDETVWVSVRRVCENLGLDASAQFKKLRVKPWSVVAVIATTAADGKQYETQMLDLECLPIWLATIETRRVKAELRPRLELYQKEAAKALADWFFGRKQQPRAVVPSDVFDGYLDAQLEAVAERIESKIVERLDGLLVQHQRKVAPETHYTIKGRCKHLGFLTAGLRDRDRIRNLMWVELRRRNLPGPIPESTAPGAELLYPHSVVDLLDECVTQIWDQVKVVERERLRPGLFDR